jgi:hypothetical protein
MIPADKITKEKPQPPTLILTPTEKKEYETHKFLVNGEVVWIYTNSSYGFDYLDKVFLRPNYIIYNEAKDMCMDNFVVVELLDEQGGYEKVNNIYVEAKSIRQRGRARVAKPNKFGLEGDIIFLKSTNNKLPFDNLAAVRFQYILGCYEKS